MDASPSIRSSYRPSQGVQYQHPKPAAHEALQKLVNNCLQGLRIYQPFQGDKALVPLSKGVFYALVHTNPVESGFLVFSPNHTPIYMHESLRRSIVVHWINRMGFSGLKMYSPGIPSQFMAPRPLRSAGLYSSSFLIITGCPMLDVRVA